MEYVEKASGMVTLDIATLCLRLSEDCCFGCCPIVLLVSSANAGPRRRGLVGTDY